MENSFQLVREHLHRAAERRKATYDTRVRKKEFAANTWVWYFNPRKYQNRSQKWQSCFTGPFLIPRLIPPVNCVIQRTQHSKPMAVHYDKIKPVLGNTTASWLRSPSGSHSKDQPSQITAPNVSEISKPASAPNPLSTGNATGNQSANENGTDVAIGNRQYRRKIPVVVGTDDVQGPVALGDTYGLAPVTTAHADAHIMADRTGVEEGSATGYTSDLLPVNASVVQGSAIGPIMYVVNAGDLQVVTPDNSLIKYADDTYLVIPACNVDSRDKEISNVVEWSRANNLKLNQAKY